MKNLLLILFLVVISSNLALALTPDGSTPAGDNMNIFITLLFIVGVIGLFYTFLITIAKLVTFEITVYNVIMSWGFYILVIIVNHLTAHYVEDVFMFNLTENFITYTPFSNILLPIIALIVTMFVKGTMKKKPLSVQELAGRQLS